MEYIAATLGILGALLIALKSRYGFICWIVGNILWIIIGTLTHQWGIVAQFSVFEIVAIIGWFNWR